MSTGLNDRDELTIVNVYPNPSIEEITIDLTPILGNASTIEFRSAIGVLVIERKVDSNKSTISIDVRELESGVYNLSILDQNRNYLSQQKLVKIRN